MTVIDNITAWNNEYPKQTGIEKKLTKGANAIGHIIGSAVGGVVDGIANAGRSFINMVSDAFTNNTPDGGETGATIENRSLMEYEKAQQLAKAMRNED